MSSLQRLRLPVWVQRRRLRPERIDCAAVELHLRFPNWYHEREDDYGERSRAMALHGVPLHHQKSELALRRQPQTRHWDLSGPADPAPLPQPVVDGHEHLGTSQSLQRRRLDQGGSSVSILSQYGGSDESCQERGPTARRHVVGHARERRNVEEEAMNHLAVKQALRLFLFEQMTHRTDRPILSIDGGNPCLNCEQQTCLYPDRHLRSACL